MQNKKTLAILLMAIFIASLAGIYYYMTRPPEKLLIYTSDSGIELMLEATIPAFTAKTGIQVEFLCEGGSGWVVNKVIAEMNSGNTSADIAIASLPSMLGAKNAGALEKYVSSEDDHIPVVFKDSDGYFTGWYAFHTVLAYNPNFVSNPPTSFEDLLNPVYAGKLAYPSPVTSGNGLRFMAALIETFGEEEAFNYLTALKPNILMYADNINDLLDKGELWVLVSDDSIITSEVLTGHLTNVKMCVTNEGAIAGYVAVAVIKNAPNMRGAKLLVDFMLSEEGQKFVTAGYGYPCREGMDTFIPADLAAIWQPFFGKPVIPLDWAEIASKMSAWKTRWSEEIP